MDYQLGTQLRRRPPQRSSKGNLFVQVRLRGVASTDEEVVLVRLCCLLNCKTTTGNTGQTVLRHCPTMEKGGFSHLLASTLFPYTAGPKTVLSHKCDIPVLGDGRPHCTRQSLPSTVLSLAVVSRTLKST